MGMGGTLMHAPPLAATPCGRIAHAVPGCAPLPSAGETAAAAQHLQAVPAQWPLARGGPAAETQ